MKKPYLLKHDKKNFTTTKKVIVANLDDFWSTTDYINIRYYRYKENIFNKNPKELIITSNKYVSFPHYTYLYNFPVEKVIFDCEIRGSKIHLEKFNNAKELEITHNGYIRIENNYGLTNIENLTIPFDIHSFDNYSMINNKIKTITIKHNDIEEIIELENVFTDREIDITINNENNILNIDIESKYSKVNYKVFIENNEIKYDKKYIKYEILPNKDKVLDLIELRHIYNCDFTANEVLTNETIIISKKDYSFLKNALFKNDKTKELIIKDDNEMSLLPRIITINLDKDRLKKIEIYNNKLMLNLEKEDKTNKYILINEDLSSVEFARDYLFSIRKVHLDFNTTKFNLTKLYGGYCITIPFNNNYDTKSSKILTHLIKCAGEIYIKTKDKEIEISKCNPDFINSLKRYNDDSFSVEYDIYENGRKKHTNNYTLYSYDELKKEYNITNTNSMGLFAELVYKEMETKKLIKK